MQSSIKPKKTRPEQLSANMSWELLIITAKMSILIGKTFTLAWLFTDTWSKDLTLKLLVKNEYF